MYPRGHFSNELKELWSKMYESEAGAKKSARQQQQHAQNSFADSPLGKLFAKTKHTPEPSQIAAPAEIDQWVVHAQMSGLDLGGRKRQGSPVYSPTSPALTEVGTSPAEASEEVCAGEAEPSKAGVADSSKVVQTGHRPEEQAASEFFEQPFQINPALAQATYTNYVASAGCINPSSEASSTAAADRPVVTRSSTQASTHPSKRIRQGNVVIQTSKPISRKLKALPDGTKMSKKSILGLAALYPTVEDPFLKDDSQEVKPKGPEQPNYLQIKTHDGQANVCIWLSTGSVFINGKDPLLGLRMVEAWTEDVAPAAATATGQASASKATTSRTDVWREAFEAK